MADNNENVTTPHEEEDSADQEAEVVDETPPPQPIEPIITIDTLAPPSTSKARSRSPSPPNQTNTTEYRVQSQFSRLKMLEETQQFSENQAFDNIDEIEGQLSLLNNIWHRFQDEHEQLGLRCRTSFFNHEYITKRVYERAYSTYHLATSSLYRHKSNIHERYIQQSLADANIRPEMPIHRSQLPTIKLPQFNGDFASWPSFRDLFQSLVIDQKHLSN
ncbi:hypothetical protein PV326_002058, partial [Microctonus aethiopoides]